MKTEIITANGKQYLKVDLIEVIQKDRSFYLAKINTSIFLNVYTVRPAQYDLEKHTSLALTFKDDADYYNHLTKIDNQNLKNKDFQRDPVKERIRDISKFINTEEYAFFPNTIIANCELINDWAEFNLNENSSLDDFFDISHKPDFISFLKKEEGFYSLVIPYSPNCVLVIDGQHRLKGLEDADDEIKQSYDLLIAFIIGYDRSVIAKQFYTINYEQKAVNKSLLYQLTGEFTTEVNEISFMHNTVKLLNELPDSPFYGRVKMLGKTPKDLSDEKKRMLSISQAFLIDSLIRFISVTAKGTDYPPIFLKLYLDPNQHITIVRSIARFFNAVSRLKKDWTIPDQSLLSKGMGVGALIRVYNLLFPVIFKKELKSDFSKLESFSVPDYERVLNGLGKIDFSSNGPYGKTGSAGSINRIKEDVILNLPYLGKFSSFKNFMIYYRGYLNDFYETI